MKKLIIFAVCAVMILSLAACGGSGTSTSAEQFGAISSVVMKNLDELAETADNEFFEYENTGSVRYGYYHSVNNEILTPDVYTGGELAVSSESDGGTYLGTPGEGDWCFVRQITDGWFYYEIHAE